jgi:hypothetical protein
MSGLVGVNITLATALPAFNEDTDIFQALTKPPVRELMFDR